MKGLFLFFFIQVSTCLVFNSPARIPSIAGPPYAGLPLAGVSAPTRLLRNFYGVAIDTSFYNQNYSVSSVSCSQTTFASVNGRIGWINSNSFTGGCQPTNFAEVLQGSGAAGLWTGNFFADTYALALSWPDDSKSSIPAFTASSPNEPFEAIGNYVPYGLLVPAMIPFNLSVQLTPPEGNPLYYLQTSGQASAVRAVWFIDQLAALSLLAIATGKIWVFLTFDGFRPGLAQIVSFVCILGAVFVWLRALGFSNAMIGVFSARVWIFFDYFPWGCELTSLLLLGFFFKELSLLTSSEAPGFNVLLWPLVVSVVLLWGTIITAGALNAARTVATTATGSFGTFQLSVFCFICAACLAITFWGSISILLSSRGTSGQSKSAILRVIILACSVACATTGFLISLTAIRAFLLQTASGMSEYSINLFVEVVGSLVPAVLMVVILMNFRISVSKEIEASKSATSSTSGTHSASSKSSTSGNDPVIEL